MTGSGLDDLLAGPRALHVRKKPTPVTVVFTTEDGVCETLEGSVRYRAGDAILTGILEERWPMARAAFEKAYEAIAPTLQGHDGTYRKHAGRALAVQLEHPIGVTVGWKADPLHGEAGDWLLRYEDGTFGLVRDDVFRKSYDQGEKVDPLPAARRS